ncbi:MAG: hypothetical protein U0V48_07300 [Anaerolineales bacterium]
MIGSLSLDWTGFKGKTLWDWMELFLIPIALAITAYWLNSQDKRIDREVAKENRQEQTLQSYLDYVSELIFEQKLIDCLPESEMSPVVKVAKAKTILALRQLNFERREAIFRFLKRYGAIRVHVCQSQLRVLQIYKRPNFMM